MAVPANLGPSLFNLGITFFILYVIILGILKLWRKIRGTSSENEGGDDDLPISDETDVEKFKEYLEELKQFAKKVSEDKANLQRLTSDPEGFPFNEVSLMSLEGQYRALQEEMEAIMEESCGASKTHLQEPQQAVDRFQEEYARFCEDMERVLKTVQARLQAPRKAKKRRTETSVETVGDGEEKYLKELTKNDQISSVLSAIRSCMNKIIIESRWNWKKTVLDISEFLGQNYQEIKGQLETSIKEARSKKGDKTQLGSLVDIRNQTDAIEKQMLDIFMTVERQAADFHAVHDTLQFFNRKFALFSEKCHSKWDAHCGRHDAACAHVHKVQEGLERGAARLAEASARLAAQAPEAVALLGRMQGTGDGVAASVRELRDAVQSTEVSVTGRLEKLAEALRRQGERLCPVLRAVEDLGLLDDLVRSSKAAVEARPEASEEDGQWGQSPSRQIISIVDDAILKTKSKYPSMQRGLLVGDGKDKQHQDSDAWESSSEVTVNDTASEFTFADSEHCFRSEA